MGSWISAADLSALRLAGTELGQILVPGPRARRSATRGVVIWILGIVLLLGVQPMDRRASGVFRRLDHDQHDVTAPLPLRGPGVRKAPVSTRAVLRDTLNAVLRDRGMAAWSNERLGKLWAWDDERVRDARTLGFGLT